MALIIQEHFFEVQSGPFHDETAVVEKSRRHWPDKKNGLYIHRYLVYGIRSERNGGSHLPACRGYIRLPVGKCAPTVLRRVTCSAQDPGVCVPARISHGYQEVSAYLTTIPGEHGKPIPSPRLAGIGRSRQASLLGTTEQLRQLAACPCVVTTTTTITTTTAGPGSSRFVFWRVVKGDTLPTKELPAVSGPRAMASLIESVNLYKVAALSKNSDLFPRFGDHYGQLPLDVCRARI